MDEIVYVLMTFVFVGIPFFLILRLLWNLGSYFKSKSRRLSPRQEHERSES